MASRLGGLLMSNRLQAIRQAQFSKDEALAWAEEYYRERHSWPRRRWRVEGSQAGNSQLLTEKQALQAQKKHGGEVVELICPARYYPDLCKQLGRPCVMDS